MRTLFNKSNRSDKRIYDLKQVEEYLDKVEGIKRDMQSSFAFKNFILR